jgi:hypothetical protein
LDVLKNIVGALVSAVLIALIFGVWNDYFYKKDRIGGYWEAEFETLKSSYRDYEGMETYYELLIAQNGPVISGVGEKVREDSVNGNIEYDTDKRNHIEFDGSITYRVYQRNRVDIVFKENGRRRKSSTVLNLTIDSEIKMTGTFISSVASSKGKVTLTKLNGI